MMFVLSQNKEYIVELKTIYSIGTKVIVNDITFGWYRSCEEADAVIADIFTCIQKGIPTYSLPAYLNRGSTMTAGMILERLVEIDCEMDQLRIESESLQDDLHEINESEKRS